MQAQDIAAQRTPDLLTQKQKRGGYRGGGRKKLYGEPTKSVKIPILRVDEVKAYLKGELPDEDRQLLDKLAVLIGQWEEKAKPYQERPRSQQGHFRAGCDLLKEIREILIHEVK